MLGTLPHRVIDVFELQFRDFEFQMVVVVLLHRQLPMMKRYHNTVRPYDEIIHLILTPMFVHQVQQQIPSMFDPNGLQPFVYAALHNDYLIFFYN